MRFVELPFLDRTSGHKGVMGSVYSFDESVHLIEVRHIESNNHFGLK